MSLSSVCYLEVVPHIRSFAISTAGTSKHTMLFGKAKMGEDGMLLNSYQHLKPE